MNVGGLYLTAVLDTFLNSGNDIGSDCKSCSIESHNHTGRASIRANQTALQTLHGHFGRDFGSGEPGYCCRRIRFFVRSLALGLWRRCGLSQFQDNFAPTDNLVQQRLSGAVAEARGLTEIVGEQIETLIGPKTFGPTGDDDISGTKQLNKLVVLTAFREGCINPVDGRVVARLQRIKGAKRDHRQKQANINRHKANAGDNSVHERCSSV